MVKWIPDLLFTFNRIVARESNIAWNVFSLIKVSSSRSYNGRMGAIYFLEGFFFDGGNGGANGEMCSRTV